MNIKTQKKKLLTVIGILLLALFLLMLKPFLSYIFPKEYALENGTAEVCFIDTGQSDCILIRTESSTVLIDSGEVGCEEIVCSFLKKRNIKTIDLAVATHPHSDHIGSMVAVFDEFEVKKLLIPQIPSEYISDLPLYDALISAAESETDCELIYASPNMNFALENNAQLTVLGPTDNYFDELNNWSVVTKFTFGEKAFLFTGDMESVAEHDLVSSNTDLSCDVLKAGHHGSRTSSSDEFLDAANPHYAVFLCGNGNVHGHPHKATKDSFKSRGIITFRTDLDGTVIFTTDGNDISIETEK